MKVLYGKPIADKIYQTINQKIKIQKNKPGLAIIMIGHNKSSEIYVNLKEQMAKKLGFYFVKYHFSSKVKENKILEIIDSLNKDKKIHGILVQIPLPKNLNTNKIINQINPQKDIDGFSTKGGSASGGAKTKFLSPVHSSILEMLSFYGFKIKNKKILILANSMIFAKPLVKILKQGGGRVEISLKKDLIKIKKAEIIIIAIGQQKFLKEKMIKDKAIIIDIGYSRIKKRAVGDVDFESCQKKASAISPVPGGIGPLTVACLMKNVLKSAKNQ